MKFIKRLKEYSLVFFTNHYNNYKEDKKEIKVNFIMRKIFFKTFNLSQQNTNIF